MANIIKVTAIPVLPVDEKHATEASDIKKLPQPVVILTTAAPKTVVNAKVREKQQIVAEHQTLTVTQSLDINQEAIKKEEQVVAEEQKLPMQNEELKNTQQELKETKKILNALKVQLVKQNKETQDLVVEKLEQVADQVEQMQRKVQLQEHNNNNSKTQVLPVKGTLLNILQDSMRNKSEDEAAAHNGIYEPKSYQAGVLLEQQKNTSVVAARLPIPLARISNISQPQTQTNNEKKQKTPDIVNETQKNLEPQPQMEAIRREILQHRQKRETETQDLLKPPKFETLLLNEIVQRKLLTKSDQ